METDQLIQEIAKRYQLSEGAVSVLVQALQQGSGSMAQFNHPELGGMGQWSRGGMIMIGDMFNNDLKARVSGALTDLAKANEQGAFKSAESSASSSTYSNQWWPAELGMPSSAGAQNDMRYAIFPAKQRLAIQQAGTIKIYDTKDHQIHGVSQQQGSTYSLSFTSQLGQVKLEELPLVQ